MFCDWRHKRCVCAWCQSQVEAWGHGGGFIAAKLKAVEFTRPQHKGGVPRFGGAGACVLSSRFLLRRRVRLSC